MRTGLVAAAIALALGGAAWAQDETPAPPSDLDTTATPAAADPEEAEPEIDTTPLAPSKPYTGECLPRLTPPGARCGVVGTSTFGADAGPNMSWQLYEIITGRQRSGLSVLFDGNQVIDTTVVPGARDEDGKHIQPEVLAGDRILFGKWSGTEVKLDGEDLLIMKESDIMGIVG